MRAPDRPVCGERHAGRCIQTGRRRTAHALCRRPSLPGLEQADRRARAATGRDRELRSAASRDSLRSMWSGPNRAGSASASMQTVPAPRNRCESPATTCSRILRTWAIPQRLLRETPSCRRPYPRDRVRSAPAGRASHGLTQTAPRPYRVCGRCRCLVEPPHNGFLRRKHSPRKLIKSECCSGCCRSGSAQVGARSGIQGRPRRASRRTVRPL